VRQGLTWEGLKYAFTSTFGFYQPLTWLSLMLDQSLGGGRASVFHATNIGIHIFNSFLVYCLSKAIVRRSISALCVACLFCVHPLSVESCVWIAERKGLLAASFGILGLIIHIQASDNRRFCLATTFYIFSFLCKPSAILLPFWGMLARSLVTTQGTPARDPSGLWFWMLSGLVGIFSIVAIFAESAAGAIADNTTSLTWERISELFSAWAISTRHLIHFSDMSIFYPRGIGLGTMKAALGVVILLGCSAVFFTTANRMRLAAFWILLSYLPVSGIIIIGQHLTADRYMYLPLVGFLWLTMIVLDRFLSNRPWIFAGSVLALTAYVFTAANGIVERWKSEERLWAHSLQMFPEHYVQHSVLGTTALFKEDYFSAIRHLEHAKRLNPNEPGISQNLGIAFLRSGSTNLALLHFRDAVTNGSRAPIVFYSLADILNTFEDEKHRREAHLLLRRITSLHFDLGTVDRLADSYIQRGEESRAMNLYVLLSEVSKHTLHPYDDLDH
jgi:protein O-mannosyl-transferase